MMSSEKNLPETVDQLRSQARKHELKISKRGDRFAILEYLASGDFWGPIEDCWGSNPHCLSFDEAAYVVKNYG